MMLRGERHVLQCLISNPADVGAECHRKKSETQRKKVLSNLTHLKKILFFIFCQIHALVFTKFITVWRCRALEVTNMSERGGAPVFSVGFTGPWL